MIQGFITISTAVIIALLLAAGVAIAKAGAQQAAEDESRHLGRLGYWVTRRKKDCHSCCLTCKYYDECKEDEGKT